MRIHLTQIGNSKGIIIPSKILNQLGFSGEIDMEIRDNNLILKPLIAPRATWEEAFAKAGSVQENLLLDDLSAEADETEWQW